MEEHSDPGIRVLVIWEPVLATDVRAPSTMTLKRISDSRVTQFWDKERLLSHAMGERDRRTIVWDYIGIFERGTLWDLAPPKAVFEDRPVVEVIERARAALARMLAIDTENKLRGLSKRLHGGEQQANSKPGGHVRTSPLPAHVDRDHARISRTTSPDTSVSRKSLPAYRNVSFSWSTPSTCRIVACRSWIETRFSTALKPNSSVAP